MSSVFCLDTEFIEDGRTIELVSIGIVAEDGREYYAINSECDYSRASDWVKEHVLAPLLPKPPLGGGLSNEEYERYKAQGWRSRDKIATEVAVFLGADFVFEDFSMKLKEGKAVPEIWADYAAYDWVALCQLWGPMINLPRGFPMYINDIQQEVRRLGSPHLPTQGNGMHNALDDARYAMACLNFLKSLG